MQIQMPSDGIAYLLQASLLHIWEFFKFDIAIGGFVGEADSWMNV
jgi:hypothetical protein